jgi:hypothetical protein
MSLHSGPDLIAKKHGLFRLMDSTYEIPLVVGNRVRWLKQRLEEAGFTWKPEMSQKFYMEVPAELLSLAPLASDQD